MKTVNSVNHVKKREERTPVAYQTRVGTVYVLGSAENGGGMFQVDGTFLTCTYSAVPFENPTVYTPIYPGESVEFIKTVTF